MRSVLSVQVDPQVLAAVRAAVAEIGQTSLQAFVTESLVEKLQREGFTTILPVASAPRLKPGRPKKKCRIDADLVVLLDEDDDMALVA